MQNIHIFQKLLGELARFNDFALPELLSLGARSEARQPSTRLNFKWQI
jgi:hypothetical protein